LPPALYSLGSQHLDGERFDLAIEAMARGHSLTEGKDAMLVEGLSRAHFTLGAKQVEWGQKDAAIDSFQTAHEIDPENLDIRRTLADSLLARGDEQLKVANLQAAKPDFERAANVSRDRRATAQMRLKLMDETPRRLKALAQKPVWLGIPSFHAEVPKDSDVDGAAEGVVYYGAFSTPQN
jgi:tetratricopeptide (TPR) repeat protein